MILYRYVPLFVSLALLAGCGDGKPPETAPAAPVEAAAPVAAPEAAPEAAPGDAGAPSAAAVDAAALYAGRCMSCHGKSAEGVGDYPSLAKLSRADIQSRMETYRSGGTVGPRSAIMLSMTRSLSDQEVAALASYLGN